MKIVLLLLISFSTGCVSTSLSYLKTRDNKTFKWQSWRAHQENDVLHLKANSGVRTLSYSYDVAKKERSSKLNVIKSIDKNSYPLKNQVTETHGH